MTHDPQIVRTQYATEAELSARAALYGGTTGPFAGDVAFEALGETAPGRDAIVRYLRSAETCTPFADDVPEEIPRPLVARRSNVVFVADKV